MWFKYLKKISGFNAIQFLHNFGLLFEENSLKKVFQFIFKLALFFDTIYQKNEII